MGKESSMKDIINKHKDTSIEGIIKKAIKADRRETEKQLHKVLQEAIAAGRSQVERKPKDIYKATERRLYAIPDLKEKLEKDRAYMKDLKLNGLAKHSADLVRFKKAGVRLSDAEILQGLIQDAVAKFVDDRHEIKAVEEALAPLTCDPYYRVISGRYFENMTDEEIAKEIPCDPRTIRRNRGRLVNRIAVRLYGAGAF